MSIDHTILGIIGLAPCSGYDIKAEVEKGAAAMLSALSFGSIYPRLRRLEQDGLIAVQESESAGRQRRVYELTTHGWQELARWLESSSAYPMPMHDELLLKMLFWGAAAGDRGALAQQLRQRRDESSELLRYIMDLPHDGVTFVDEYTMLVFSYLHARLEAELSWIESALTQLEGAPQLPVQDPHWLAVLQKARRNKAQGQTDTP